MSSLQRILAISAALLTSLFVAGCGGSGAGAQGSGGDTSGVIEAAAVQVTSSAPTINSDGRAPVTINVFVKDSSNRALANQQISFALVDPVGSSGGLLKDIVARTDASGTASATLMVTDPTIRTVTVRAQTGSLTGSVDLPVIGTTLSLNGPTTLVSNAPTEFTVGLRDAAGGVLVGKAVSIASSAGNTLSAPSVTTDSAGQARFLLTGTKSGTDTVTVSSLGASTALAVSVASTQLAFVAPAPAQELPVDTDQSVTVAYVLNGAPQAGKAVEFLATRGTLVPANAVTDASGRATAKIRSGTAGISTITARVDGLLGSQRVEFVSTTPAKLALQSSPANVGVNLTATSTNSSQLIAVVRDANDNPVKGQTVSFSAVLDPSNGRIEPAVATTDSSGVATVAFFPGANSSGFNQIQLRAEIPGKGVSGTTSLTASKQELVVRVGTGNQLEEIDLATNSMPWSAVVTDASGNPIVGASVQVSLVATGYYKGWYIWNAARKAWVPVGGGVDGEPFYCVSEDLIGPPAGQGNLRLDAGEDRNSDGQLTPGTVGAALVTSANGRTDSNGLASIRVNYPKDYGTWTEMRLRVTITTLAGTEGAAERPFVLPVMAKDVGNEVIAPPGQPSPFGRVADCTTTN